MIVVRGTVLLGLDSKPSLSPAKQIIKVSDGLIRSRVIIPLMAIIGFKMKQVAAMLSENSHVSGLYLDSHDGAVHYLVEDDTPTFDKLKSTLDSISQMSPYGLHDADSSLSVNIPLNMPDFEQGRIGIFNPRAVTILSFAPFVVATSPKILAINCHKQYFPAYCATGKPSIGIDRFLMWRENPTAVVSLGELMVTKAKVEARTNNDRQNAVNWFSASEDIDAMANFAHYVAWHKYQSASISSWAEDLRTVTVDPSVDVVTIL